MPQFILFIAMTWGVSAVSVIVDLAAKRPLDVLSPFLLVPATMGFVYTGTPEFLSSRGDSSGATLASTALLVGMASYLLGAVGARLLVFPSPFGTQSRPFATAAQRPRAVYMVFAFGALSMIVYWLRTGGIPLFQSDLENSRVEALSGNGVPFFLSMLMMVAVWTSLSPRSGVAPRSKWIMFILAAMLLGSTGWRNTIITFVLVTLFLLHYTRPIRGLYIAIAGVAALLMAVGLGLWRISSSTLENYQTFQLMSRGDLFGAISSYLRSYADIFGQNLALTMSVAERGFALQNGETFIWNFINLLPGEEREPFDFVLKQAAGQTFAGGGLPPTLIGEWYINFGWVGIAVGMILFGGVVALAHATALKTSSFPTLIVAVIVANYSFIAVRGGIGNIVLTVVWLSVATAIVGRIALGTPTQGGGPAKNPARLRG